MTEYMMLQGFLSVFEYKIVKIQSPFIWFFLGIDVYDKDKMNLLWIEDFPLFLPKEDGSEGQWQLVYYV